MQRRKHLTVRQRMDAKVEWRATNLRLRQKHLHSSQMNFEDYIDYVAGYCAKDNTPATGPVGGNLVFFIGDSSTDKVELPFANNVEGELKTGWSFPLSTVLTILKLSDTSTMNMKISDQGAMMIMVDSGLGIYEYILPAKAGH